METRQKFFGDYSGCALCKERYYYYKTKDCIKCNESCQTCISAQCLTCNGEYFINLKQNSFICSSKPNLTICITYGSEGCIKCEERYYENEYNYCSECKEGCLACNSQTEYTKCEESYILTNSYKFINDGRYKYENRSNPQVITVKKGKAIEFEIFIKSLCICNIEKKNQ